MATGLHSIKNCEKNSPKLTRSKICRCLGQCRHYFLHRYAVMDLSKDDRKAYLKRKTEEDSQIKRGHRKVHEKEKKKVQFCQSYHCGT